jgi:nitroreductase
VYRKLRTAIYRRQGMEVIQVLKERRSINFFDASKTIPDETVNELLSIANLTPSSFNLQPWEVVVVKSPERKQALRKCAFNQPKAEEASIVLIIIANPGAVEENLDRVVEVMIEKGYLKPEAAENAKKGPYRMYDQKDTFKRKIFAVKNTSFFGMSIMAAARGLGLETHPMDGFDEAAVKKEFNIPEDRLIPLLIAVGYPVKDLKLLPRAYRRELKDFVYTDRFGQ